MTDHDTTQIAQTQTARTQTAEKKSERLEVRLGYREKGAFVEACELQGDTPSGAVRRFINGYTRRADSDVLGSAWRGAARRRVVPVAVMAGGLALVVAGLWWGSMRAATPTDDDIFAARDRNGDGQWDISEHRLRNAPGEPQDAVLRVLDLDASGTISRDEFVREGLMMFSVENPDAIEVSDDNTITITPRFTLVDFAFGIERTRISTFADARVNASGIDRVVVWPSEGVPTVLAGDVAITSADQMTVMADSVRVEAVVPLEMKGSDK